MLKILDEREQNSFYDPEKANNGGGYHQPRIEFEFEGIQAAEISGTVISSSGATMRFTSIRWIANRLLRARFPTRLW